MPADVTHPLSRASNVALSTEWAMPRSSASMIRRRVPPESPGPLISSICAESWTTVCAATAQERVTKAAALDTKFLVAFILSEGPAAA